MQNPVLSGLCSVVTVKMWKCKVLTFNKTVLRVYQCGPASSTVSVTAVWDSQPASVILRQEAVWCEAAVVFDRVQMALSRTIHALKMHSPFNFSAIPPKKKQISGPVKVLIFEADRCLWYLSLDVLENSVWKCCWIHLPCDADFVLVDCSYFWYVLFC